MSKILILTFLILTGCCNKARICTQHEIIEQRYCDPGGLFSVLVPFEGEWIVEETSLPTCSGVIFCEGSGCIVRVEALQIPDQDLLSLNLEASKEERGEILRALFIEKVIPLIIKSSLKAELLKEEIVSLGEEPASFVLLSISNDKRGVIEGFLSCFIGDQYVIFSKRVFCLNEAENLLEELKGIYSSYRNERIGNYNS